MSDDTANTVNELRDKLQRLGIAESKEVVVAEGFDGSVNAAVMFLASQGITAKAVGFHTSQISLAAAREVVAELTALKRQPLQRRGPYTLTPYIGKQ